jgi:Bacterial Ig-like domain
MRNPVASALALPGRGLTLLSHAAPRSSVTPPALVIGAILIVVAGLLVGLPAKNVTAQSHDTFSPLAPQGNAIDQRSDLPLDVPFEVRFTKPMNPGTVASALQISPVIDVRYLWDATGQVLKLAPVPFWHPYQQYTVAITTGATDQEGLNLAQPIQSSFQAGSPTSGEITASKVVGDRVAPTTVFKVTFTRPVKLSTVLLRVGISPAVDVSILGDDPTDQASQVFTLTPRKPLATDMTYLVAMTDNGTDAAGSELRPVSPKSFKTLANPSATFTPQSGAVTYDTNQLISIHFSEPMDQKSAAAALSVQQDGRTLKGTVGWADDGLTMTFNSRYSFYVGATITVRVATSARSLAGMPMAATGGVDFLVSTPRSRSRDAGTRIPYVPGGVATGSAQWHNSELYYLNLMNCTRTGGWVTSAGMCSTQTHHTLPPRGPLAYHAGIANAVARPYAAAMAVAGVLTHTMGGTTIHTRLSAQGYGGASWGENIASPGRVDEGGMISVEIFFQNEYWCRCAHYANIMNSHFGHVGVGIWVDSGRVRVVADFYS